MELKLWCAIYNMKMSKSIRRNYIYNLFYQAITILTPLITAPYLSRVLGPQCIGELSYTESITSYFVIFATLGISIYGAREISYVQNDIQKRTDVFWNTKILTLITTIICLSIYFPFIYLFKQSKIILFLFSSVLIINVFFDVTWFFQGMEEFGKIVLRNTIIRILNILFIFVFVHSVKDFYIYVLGAYGLQTISSLSLWPMLKKYIYKPSRIRPFSNIKTVISLFIPTIAISIYTVLDKTMIGVFTANSYENGYYEQALRLSKMILTIVTSLGVVMVPRIGVYVGKGDYGSVRKYMYRSYRFVFFLGIPLYLGLFVVSENLVPWFFGVGYEKVIPLLKILGLLILAIGINNVTGVQYLIPTKRQNIFTFTVIIGAILNFALNLFLIPLYFSIGAAIASVIAESVIAIIQLIIVRKELSFVEILKQNWKYLLSGFIMFVSLYFVENKLEASVLNTLLLFIVGVFIYFSCLLVFKDSFFIETVLNLKNKISRRGTKNDEKIENNENSSTFEE